MKWFIDVQTKVVAGGELISTKRRLAHWFKTKREATEYAKHIEALHDDIKTEVTNKKFEPVEF